MRIFPRAKFVLLPPEATERNGSETINSDFGMFNKNSLHGRKDDRITENQELVTSNGVNNTLQNFCERTDNGTYNQVFKCFNNIRNFLLYFCHKKNCGFGIPIKLSQLGVSFKRDLLRLTAEQYGDG